MSAEPDSDGMSRRDLLRRSAVGGATVAGVSAGAIRLDHGPVQESEAIAPAVVAGAAAAGGVSVGWTLREFDPLGSDSPDDGMTPSALVTASYDTIEARNSNNQSTFMDNKNIAESVDHSAWADAKIAAIESLNDQESQSDVQSAAMEAIADYERTVVQNLARSWDETVNELDGIFESLNAHDDTEDQSILWHFEVNEWEVETVDYEVNDYHTIEINEIDWEFYGDGHVDEISSGGGHPFNGYSVSVGPDVPEDDPAILVQPSYEDSELGPTLILHQDWTDIAQTLTETFDDVRDGVSLWVDEVYNDVQSGELDVDELLTPREQAELTSDDEDFPQAIADLQALNVSVDLEREAEIYMPDISATLYGQLAYTGDETLEVGTINPDATDDDGDPLYPGTIYFNYDMSQGQGEWDAYEDGIDGGTLTLTSEPFEDTIYYVDTTAGETAEFVTDDLTENDDGDEWTIDLSDQLDDQITEVDLIEYYAETESTQYETIQLQDEFEIITFTDSDGEEYEETNFERSEPHDDDNYITEEEWQEQQERNEELIEKYEDAQGGVSIPGIDDVLDGEANGFIGMVVVGAFAVITVLSALNPAS